MKNKKIIYKDNGYRIVIKPYKTERYSSEMKENKYSFIIDIEKIKFTIMNLILIKKCVKYDLVWIKDNEELMEKANSMLNEYIEKEDMRNNHIKKKLDILNNFS